MVSAHCWLHPYSVRDTAQSPGQRVRYLQREGEFAPVAYLERRGGKTKDYTDYVTGGTQHLPEWAKGNPSRFFTAAAQHEGSNRYYAFDVEFSLPRELTHEQHMALTSDFLDATLPGLPALWVKHDKELADGGRHPHIHIVFSARQDDGMARGSDQMFRRWNRHNPAEGGARKDLFWSKHHAPEQLRQAFADITNFHLEQAGVAARLDPRSLVRQDIHRAIIRHGSPPRSPEEVAAEQRQAAQAWEQRKAYKELGDLRSMAREEFVLHVRQWTRQYERGTALPRVSREVMRAYEEREDVRLRDEQPGLEREVARLTRHSTRLSEERQYLERGVQRPRELAQVMADSKRLGVAAEAEEVGLAWGRGHGLSPVRPRPLRMDRGTPRGQAARSRIFDEEREERGEGRIR